MFSILLVCLLFPIFAYATTDDPCQIAKQLPNFDLRVKVYKIDPNKDIPMCDRYFIKEPGEWFRTEDGNEMVNNKTSFFECGTQYSIYMQGNIPTALNTVVNRTACVVPNCRTSYAIQLKRCGHFTAYFLPRPSSCDEAYCFGFGENGIAPNKTINKPTVHYELIKVPGKIIGDLSEQKLAFRCDFTPVVDGTNIIYYKVFWYINDQYTTIFVSKAVPEHSLHETYLRGENGLNSIKLNIEISCKVRLYYNPKGPPGPSSVASEKFFAGVQPVNRTYSIERDKSTDIQFKLTVPFGCQYVNPNDPAPIPCSHSILLTTPDYLKCSQGIYAVDMCGKRVDSRYWNKTQDISVQHKNDLQYFTKETFEIHLETKVRTDGEPFWDGVKLPVIFINVLEGPNQWKEARCSAISDPHMKGFMTKPYESQDPGTYTLYRRVDTLGNVNEIQMKVTSCYYYEGHMNQCACAIAVRASSDIYVIDKCPETVPNFFGFKSCVEDLLHVVKKRTDEHKYEIHFPSGTFVGVKFTWVVDPRSNTGKWTLDLHVNPSVDDHQLSQGLCGEVGSNKFFSPKRVDLSHDIPEFTKSWRIDDANNMFLMSMDKLQSFPKTNKTRDLCICKSELSGSITETITCTDNNDERIQCNAETDLKPVQKDTCYERHNRKKRSLRHSFTYIPQILVQPKRKKTKVKKRSVYTQMTEPQARAWCENFMGNSPGYMACKDIPKINTERAVEVCVLDIMASNTTIFASAPRESVKTQCLTEISQNETLRNISENGESIAKKILDVACPEECSNHGVCMEGICKCDDGYGGGDCSVDTNEPPPVYAVNYETGGLCDKLFCKQAVVEGDFFLDKPELTCSMQKFEVDINGTSWDLETSRVTGDHNTLSDIRCKFPHSVNKRSTTSSRAFITGYMISVSNNNRNFSDAHAIYILDSTCQDTMNVSGQLRFVLKPGFCFIHGSCVADGFQKRCYECDIQRNVFEWTFRESEKDCKSEETASKMWIIGVVLGTLVAVLVLLIIVKILKRRESVSMEYNLPSPPRQTQSQEHFVNPKNWQANH